MPIIERQQEDLDLVVRILARMAVAFATASRIAIEMPDISSTIANNVSPEKKFDSFITDGIRIKHEFETTDDKACEECGAIPAGPHFTHCSQDVDPLAPPPEDRFDNKDLFAPPTEEEKKGMVEVGPGCWFRPTTENKLGECGVCWVFRNQGLGRECGECP